MSTEQPVTLRTLAERKRAGQKFACLTAYDYTFARILDEAGVDVVLVGDTLGMVVQGHPTTIPVTLDDMIYHTRSVARGCDHALLMADMPFMTYATPEQALAHAGRLMQEAGAHVVKLEGGADQVAIVERLTRHGVPVCAHLGIRPQSVYKAGGYRVPGRDPAEARQLRADAEALEQAGADLLLLECVPATVAAEITAAASVPVIGIGSGADCDGQVLVLYDMLGLTPGRHPRFVRDFLAEADGVQAAVAGYVAAVRSGRFPGAEHSY